MQRQDQHLRWDDLRDNLQGGQCRNYARSLEPLPSEVSTRGVSKSAVSRRFVAATSEALTTLMSRDLSTLSLCAMAIDGIHVAEHLVVVALGFDENGEKHVLGLCEGATENEAVCATLLGDIVARGVRANRAMLFVIDGSKGLASAIRKTFGKRALIQRCQVHKRRNVEDHLPESMKKNVGCAMTTAYRCGNAERAKRLLHALARQLERKHLSAANSLREGLDETLTVMRFRLPSYLERTLSTTNTIEFVNSRIRKTTTTSPSGTVERWCSVGSRWRSPRPPRPSIDCAEAAKTFHRLRGHKGMPLLVAALRTHELSLNPSPIDGSEKAT